MELCSAIACSLPVPKHCAVIVWIVAHLSVLFVSLWAGSVSALTEHRFGLLCATGHRSFGKDLQEKHHAALLEMGTSQLSLSKLVSPGLPSQRGSCAHQAARRPGGAAGPRSAAVTCRCWRPGNLCPDPSHTASFLSTARGAFYELLLFLHVLAARRRNVGADLKPVKFKGHLSFGRLGCAFSTM